MAVWGRRAYNSNTSIPNMDSLFHRDELASICKEYNSTALLNGTGLHQTHPPPLTFFPACRGAGLENMNAGGTSTPKACSNMIMMESMKRPFFWPFLDMEKVQGSLTTTENIVEQSCSSSEYHNMCNIVRMERMLRSHEYSNEEGEVNEGDSSMMRTRKKKRLTGEQVNALEGSFEADKKLEAERKQELAQRLGLKPRQVAIWFQNRRARSKTKHLEHDFTLLKDRYHTMLAETHKLRSEVSRLAAELEAYKTKGTEAAMTLRTKPASYKTFGNTAVHENAAPSFADLGSDHCTNINECILNDKRNMDSAVGNKMHESIISCKEMSRNVMNEPVILNMSTDSPSCCSDFHVDGGRISSISCNTCSPCRELDAEDDDQETEKQYCPNSNKLISTATAAEAGMSSCCWLYDNNHKQVEYNVSSIFMTQFNKAAPRSSTSLQYESCSGLIPPPLVSTTTSSSSNGADANYKHNYRSLAAAGADHQSLPFSLQPYSDPAAAINILSNHGAVASFDCLSWELAT